MLLGYCVYEGTELFNNQRVLDYLFGDPANGRPGMASPYASINRSAACRSAVSLYCDRPADGFTYSTPALDPAPWYDPAIPASAEFAGLLVEDVTGLDTSTVSREVTESDLLGGSLGPTHYGSRSMTVTGWLRATSVRGVDYGLQWLTEALTSGMGGSDDLMGELYMLASCPPEDENSPDPLDYVRLMYRVGLADGPKVIDTHTAAAAKHSLLTRGQHTAGRDGATMRKIQFTIISESPWVFSDVDWATYGSRLTDGPFDYLLGGPGVAGQNCLGGCDGDPAWTAPDCAGPVFPRPPAFVGFDGCYCDPWETRRHSFTIETSVEWNDLTAVVEIQAGLLPVKGFRLVAFANPALHTGVECPVHWEVDPAWHCIEPCMSVGVSHMPSGSKLTIDSRTRSVVLTLAGGRQVPGLGYISSGIDGKPFDWFDIDWCSTLCVVASVNSHYADGIHVSAQPDVTYSVGIANRYKVG